MPTATPYGGWRSPIDARLVAAQSVRLTSPAIDGTDVYWVETRPGEGGRGVLVRLGADGERADLTPPGYSVRSRAHEYGGGAYRVLRGTVYFCNDADQRLYRHPPGGIPGPLTPPETLRYAEPLPDPTRRRLICVREDHRVASREPVNALVAIGLDAAGDDPGRVLAQGADFYASACLSPDGKWLAWLSWNHPDMPWNGTELWRAEVLADGGLGSPARVAGGRQESVFEPQWSPNGRLHFVSDRSGWWNLYRWDGQEARCLWPVAAELGLPQWLFGMSTYACTADGACYAAYSRDGTWGLARLAPEGGPPSLLECPYSEIEGVCSGAPGVVFLGGSPEHGTRLARLDPATGQAEVLHQASAPGPEPEDLSRPQAIRFPTTGGEHAHALYYPPVNRAHRAPRAELPPLLVKSHGGPTAAASATLSLATQYWSTRGLAVVDVNYRGSTGYGRAYRERLDGEWGVVDVDDCVHAARHLVEQGLADPRRLIIRGSSAGGYTTLAALTFRDQFRAGASHYGISELESLARDTHKFESRYLDRLIGPYPQRRDLYRARSPLYHADRFTAPAIFFQGLEDRVVPPAQAERMVAALRDKGLPVAYVTFPGEQHGFRRAASIRRALEAELYFYSRVFGFALAEPVDPVEILNLA